MELYFVILTIFFLRVYSYETFLKTARGPTQIVCHQNSLFVTNDTSLLNDCKMKKSCFIPANKAIQYYCVKGQFHPSNCYQIKDLKRFTSTGCYATDYPFFTGLNPLNKYYHFLPLYQDLETVKEGDNYISHNPTFSHMRLQKSDKVVTVENSWFLLKVSNESEEDFGEFFTESSQIATQVTTKGINTFPMTTILKERNQSILEDKISPSTTVAPKENTFSSQQERSQSIFEDKISPSTTVAPKENTFSSQQVFIIVGVVIDLLTFSLLAAFVFYRKIFRKETMNSINEIPLDENERIRNSLPEDRVTRHQFNNRLGINMANETRLDENEYDKLSDGPGYIDCI